MRFAAGTPGAAHERARARSQAAVRTNVAAPRFFGARTAVRAIAHAAPWRGPAPRDFAHPMA